MQDLVETEVHKYSFASLYQVNSATELSRHKITVWLVTATMRSARLKIVVLHKIDSVPT